MREAYGGHVSGSALASGEEGARWALLAAMLVERLDDRAIGVVDPEGRVLTWSPGAEQLLGLPAERVVGRRLGTILGGPRSEEVARRWLARARSGEHVEQTTLVVDPRRQGALERVLEVRCVVQPLLQGEELLGFGVILEVPAEQKVRGLLDSITDAFIAVDGAWRVSWANQRAAALLERPREEVLGRVVWRLLPRDVVARYRPIAQEIMDRSEPCERELEIPGDRWLNVHAYPCPEGLTLYLLDITDRKRAERAVAKLTEELSSLVEASPIAIVSLDPAGRVDRWNPAAEQIFGWSQQEVLGRPLPLMVFGKRAERVLEQNHRGVVYEVQRRDRTRCHVSVSSAPRLGPRQELRGVVLLFEDVTQRIQAEARQWLLTAAGKRLAGKIEYEAVLDAIPELVVPRIADFALLDLVEEDGSVRRVRARAADPDKQGAVEALLRFPPTGRAPLGIARVLRTGQPELVCQVTEAWLHAVSEGRAHRQALREVNPRTEILVPLRARGRTLGALSLARERGAPYTEEELQLAVEMGNRAALALDNARLYEQTRDAVRTRDEVLRIVAHDLRNPLGVIGYAVDVIARRLAETSECNEVLDQLHMVKRNVNRAQKLVGDLLDVARIEARNLVVEPRSELLHPLLQEVAEMHRPRAREQQIALEQHAPPDLPVVRVDRDRIIQVLGNLVENALKHTPAGGRVTLSAAPCERGICLAVEDTGEGIAPDLVGKVFAPFFQQRPGPREGAGLGLAIARGIIQAHGGDISIESRLGVGTIVRFTLPVAGDGVAR